MLMAKLWFLQNFDNIVGQMFNVCKVFNDQCMQI